MTENRKTKAILIIKKNILVEHIPAKNKRKIRNIFLPLYVSSQILFLYILPGHNHLGKHPSQNSLFPFGPDKTELQTEIVHNLF